MLQGNINPDRSKYKQELCGTWLFCYRHFILDTFVLFIVTCSSLNGSVIWGGFAVAEKGLCSSAYEDRSTAP
jgi:hypothetical protein